MTRRLRPAGLALVFIGCAHAPASAPSERPASSPAASSTADEDAGAGSTRVLRPDQIFSILDESLITYDIIASDLVARSGLAEVTDQQVPRSRPVDAYVALTGEEGSRRVASQRPPAEIAEHFGRASEAFAAGNLDEARRLYAEATELAPNYFKTYTYLGNTLHLLGNHAEAEVAFQRALSLNPIDYQALLFLGDTYVSMGQFHRAKAVLLRAYLFNRTSEAVKDRLNVTLAKLDMRLRDERLSPEFKIERTAERRVELRFDGERGIRWLALAACMACWAYEERCQARASEEDDPLRIFMYRECLINHAAALAVRRDQSKGALLSDERALLGAIEEGYLEAIIFWEVIGEVAPRVIYLLPTALQDDIVKYIERFVIVSTRLV